MTAHPVRTLLSLLAVLALTAAPITAADASASYSVSTKLNHLHIKQGSKVTISGTVAGDFHELLVDIEATQGRAPYANTFHVGYASVSSSGKFTKSYAPITGGTFYFRVTVTDRQHIPIDGSAATSHALKVSAAHPSTTSNQLVVIGDSISDPALYNDRSGSTHRAWWSFLRSKTRLEPHIYAQRGSGYGKPGSCNGATPTTTFDQRITYPSIAKRLAAAKVVVIEGGINDYLECVQGEDGNYVGQPADPDRRAAAVEAAMQHLDDLVKANSRVFVIVPWGPRPDFLSYHDAITQLVRTTAEAHGFTYVNMADGTLTETNTRDGVHPNEAGSRAMYGQLYYTTDLRIRFPR